MDDECKVQHFYLLRTGKELKCEDCLAYQTEGCEENGNGVSEL